MLSVVWAWLWVYCKYSVGVALVYGEHCEGVAWVYGECSLGMALGVLCGCGLGVLRVLRGSVLCVCACAHACMCVCVCVM